MRAAVAWFFTHGVLVGVYEPLANVLRLLQVRALGGLGGALGAVDLDPVE